MDFAFVVLIPTYNRKEKLKRTLDYLSNQSDQEFDVIISDNASDYNVDELLDHYDCNFKKRIRICKRIINTQFDVNFANLFIEGEGYDWAWVIPDDDIIPDFSVRIIKNDIKKNFEFAWIEYPVFKSSEIEIEFHSLDEWINYTYKKSKERNLNIWGDMVYVGNKLYNLKLIKMILHKLFAYSYTRISSAVATLTLLDNNQAGKYIFKDVIYYDATGGTQWDTFSMAFNFRTFYDIDFNLNKKQYRKLCQIVAPKLIYWIFLIYNNSKDKNNIKKAENYKKFKILYFDIYKTHFPILKRFKFFFIMKIANNKLLLYVYNFIITNYETSLKRLYHKIKGK